MSTNRHHVAIITLPGNGHVYSTLGICSELIKRGFRVTYVTSQEHAEKVRLTGAEPLLVKFPAGTSKSNNQRSIFDAPQDPNWWHEFGARAFHSMLDLIPGTLSQLEALYEGNTPDLILHEPHGYGYTARVLARRLHARTMLIAGDFAQYNKFLIRENGIFTNPEPMLEVAQAIDLFLSTYGIEEKDNLWHVAESNIYFIPKEFQYHADSFDSRFCFVGACLNRPFRPMWKNRSNGKPIILICNASFSTDSSYFRTFIDALAGSKYHVILSIVGAGITEGSLGVLPDNFEINRHASHLEILPNVALVIGQGGMQTSLEAVYHGVPQVAVPMMPFNDSIAFRVAELGLGIHLPRRELSIETARDCVESALGDAEILWRVKNMRENFKSAGGAKLAADKVEQFLGL